ncbi:hypothetical protein ABW19_dt0207901 [Dactylella cylindrospora]|nr:hypothetical protein ABW19_dt0207901 [Dactylella cylindrospora]
MKKAVQILGALATVQSALATGYYDWKQPFNSYTCGDKTCNGRDVFVPPQYSNEKCTEKRYTGYDFSDAPVGNLPTYDDFNFSGYNCETTKLQKRTGRGSGNKCASSYVEPDTYSNEIKCNSKFSVDEFDISTEYESVIEFTYGMPDGSSCKHVSKCGTGITPIKNTQCGGAKSVKCKIHKSSPSKKKCKLNVHHIKFRCDKPPTSSSTTEPYVPPSETEPYVPPVETEPCYGDNCNTTSEPAPTTTVCNGYDCSGSTTSAPSTEPTVPSETEPYVPPVETEPTAPCYGDSCSSTAAPSTTAPVCDGYECSGSTTTAPTTEPTVPSETEPYVPPVETEPTEPCYGDSCSSTAAPTTTESAPTTSDVYVPPTDTYVPPTDTYVPPTDTYVPPTDIYVPPTDVYVPPVNTSVPYETVPPTETAPVTDTPVSTTDYTPIPSVPVETGCPPVLPQCMTTWTKITQCIDSGDVKCLCPNAEYIKNVAECVEAWGVDDDEVAKALEYMQGLCAEQIPENPAIVTCIPTYVTLPPATSGATTVTISTTVVVPCTTAPPEETTQPGYTPSYTTEVVATTVTVCPVKLVTTEPNKPVLVPGTVTAPPYVPTASSMPSTAPVDYPTSVYAPTTMATVYPTAPVANATTSAPPIATGAASLNTFSSLMAAGIVGAVALIMA